MASVPTRAATEGLDRGLAGLIGTATGAEARGGVNLASSLFTGMDDDAVLNDDDDKEEDKDEERDEDADSEDGGEE